MWLCQNMIGIQKLKLPLVNYNLNLNIMKNNYRKIYFGAVVFFLFFLINPSAVKAETLASKLSGKILLQVEENGEAYYVNPVEQKRYYLGRPADAFNVMRSLGLGVSNVDINNFLKNGARANLSGRILLQVQDKGQAYYVNPANLKLYYLGRPTDAFSVMRSLGLGISNVNLNQIPLSLNSVNPSPGTSQPTVPSVSPGEKIVKFSWKYKNKNYILEQTFTDAVYNSYKNSQKYLSYPANNPPVNFRESYYNIFLTLKSGDLSLDNLLRDLKKLSDQAGYSSSEYLEFVLAFIQYIPYDTSKTENSPQNFPYETLYKNSGICSDKTFLAVLMLRKMGYGSAVFDYPDIKHSAAAVSCSGQSSYSSGYCFVETTNYFPIGVFPSGLNSGQASSGEINWESIFKGDNLGKLEVYQKTSGQLSYSMDKNVNTVNTVIKLKSSLATKSAEIAVISGQLSVLRSELDQIIALMTYYKEKGDISNYNATVADYNAKVENYNAVLSSYRLKAEIYNNDINLYNQTVSSFFQN